jgi:hypothetical protein
MNNGSRGGVSICTVVGIVFIILKLVGVITWSWVWVLCPFWIPIVILILVLIFAFIIDKLDNIFHS